MSGRTTVWNTGLMTAPARGFGQWEEANPGYSADEARFFLENELIPELLGLIEQAKRSGLSLNDFFRNCLNDFFRNL